MTLLNRIAMASIAVALAVFGLKLVAWRLTGSVALYSDALESIVNVAAAVVAYGAVWVASKPADDNHPFGHTKAEYISAVVEGVLIVVAALAVLRAAWFAFLDPAPILAPAAGLAVNILASLLNAAWAFMLIRVGGRNGSPALVADGRHLLADVISSAGVAAGLIVAILSGIHVLDSLLAAAVGCFILWSGWHLVRESLGGLMDEAPSAEVQERIQALIAENAGGAIQVHDIRTRRAGRATFVEFHLVVDGAMPVSQSHAICDRIETALKAEIKGVVATIHVEPHTKAKSEGVLDVA